MNVAQERISREITYTRARRGYCEYNRVVCVCVCVVGVGGTGENKRRSLFAMAAKGLS